jgi:hypothetical protein
MKNIKTLAAFVSVFMMGTASLNAIKLVNNYKISEEDLKELGEKDEGVKMEIRISSQSSKPIVFFKNEYAVGTGKTNFINVDLNSIEPKIKNYFTDTSGHMFKNMPLKAQIWVSSMVAPMPTHCSFSIDSLEDFKKFENATFEFDANEQCKWN